MARSSIFSWAPSGALLFAAAVAVAGGCGSSLGTPGGTGGSPPTGVAGGSGTIGTAGAGGGGGGAGTVGGMGGNSGDACLPPSPVYPRLSIGSLGTEVLAAYDGPAIVERSVGTELTLAYDDATTLRHARISGLDGIPLFPPGARVWLSRTQDSNAVFAPPQPTSFSVRSAEGGPLLLGAARNSFNVASSPVGVSPARGICTAPAPLGCLPSGSTVTYAEATVIGDADVVVRDGVPGSVTIDGIAYDVRMLAQTTQVATGMLGCADYFPFAGVSLDIVAKDLASRAAGLTVGSPPACGQGNDPMPKVEFGLYVDSIPSSFEGAVTYVGPDPYQPGFLFEIPGLPPTSGNRPARLFIRNAASLLPEPSMGAQFWLSSVGGSRALLEASGGPVVVAQVSATPDANAAAHLATTLGVGVTLEKGCTYWATVNLWSAAFATTPAVRLPSGTSSMFTIAGRSYRAWMWNEYSLSLTVARAN